jgi:prepilin-type N-terminal cleavage/methylation domain-containing protein
VRKPRGFTLVECLFAIFLMALVLPAVNLGLTAASHSAATARRRAEASGLAQSKIAELISDAQTQSLSGENLSGDFGPDWKDYHWTAAVNTWVNDPQPVNMQQLDVTIVWPDKGPQEQLTISTLVYVRP